MTFPSRAHGYKRGEVSSALVALPVVEPTLRFPDRRSLRATYVRCHQLHIPVVYAHLPDGTWGLWRIGE